MAQRLSLADPNVPYDAALKDLTVIGGSLVPAEFAAFMTQRTDAYEINHRQLFSSVSIATTQSAKQNFFSDRTLNARQQSNVFPYENAFVLCQFGLVPDWLVQTFDMGTSGTGGVASYGDDIAQIFNKLVLQLQLNQKKVYGPWRGHRITGGSGMSGALAAAGAENANQVTGALSPGSPATQAIYTLSAPLVFPMNSGVAWTLDWPDGALSLSVARILNLYLEGFEITPS